METIAVFINDAGHARHILQPMLRAQGPTHWILVACAPRLTRHIGRWLSNAARQQWRERWAAELFADIEPDLKMRSGSSVEKLLAKRPLTQLSARLESRRGGVRLLDARRPRFGKYDEPLTETQASERAARWADAAVVATGLSALLSLAD